MLAARDAGSWTKAALCLSFRFQYLTVLLCPDPEGPAVAAAGLALVTLPDVRGLLDVEGEQAKRDWLEELGVGSRPEIIDLFIEGLFKPPSTAQGHLSVFH